MDGRRSLMMAKRSASAQVANVGDIAYKAPNGKIKVVNTDAWSTSLGTPIGVVVIPSGFAPDNGKARIVSLYYVDVSGNQSNSSVSMKWSTGYTDTSLTNHAMVPITDNAGSTATGSGDSGCLPSDKFTGATSYVDSTAKYYGSISYFPCIPSPYLGDAPNPAYYAPISGYNNALADFDGKGNTDALVALGAKYEAANAARNYKAIGAEEIEWYLPALGELGYFVVRYNKINAALAKISASQLTSYFYWSSSEQSNFFAYFVLTDDGSVESVIKIDYCYVRPFAMLDF